jgi:hypothetical protein
MELNVHIRGYVVLPSGFRTLICNLLLHRCYDPISLIKNLPA